MTSKNAKKSAARARKENLGGKYQHHLRQVGGASGASSDVERSVAVTKYLHIEYGTSRGTAWLLSDDPNGARLPVSVPAGPLTPQMAEEAFAQAAFPLINETSADGGKTWIQHLDVEPQRVWRSALHLIYGLLGAGGGTWDAARIRARNGEELVRHPPRVLTEIADQVRAVISGANIILRAPNDQLFVRLGERSFVVGTLMNLPDDWPVYVCPTDSTEHGGSWECPTMNDVLGILQHPTLEPRLRFVTVDEIRSRSIRKEVMVGRKGGAPNTYYVTIRPDAEVGETLEDGLQEARREARLRPNLLEVGIRRSDRPGHPWVCAWKRKTVSEAWTFEWREGADHPAAEPLSLVIEQHV